LQLNSTDLTRIKRTETDDVQAYELFLKGRDVFQRFSREDTYAAQELFKQALAHDQNFANAYALLAWAYAFEVINGWSETPEKTLATALEIANKALSLNERQPVAYFVKVLVFRERREYKKALELAQKAIEINPNYANAYVILSTVLYYTGQAEEGLRMVEKAERINPMHPSNYPFHKGQALFILKQYDEAIEAFSKGLEQNPTSQRLRVWLAVAYAQAGQMEDAMWEAEQILDEDPDFKLSRLLHVFPFQDPADLEHFNVALRKLGLEDRW
jgi:tetratricopeptide (TPR) repeat protein